MNDTWEFQHSIVTKAPRSVAWAFWSDMRNHEKEAGVERIELDGPFESGTTGRTIAEEFTQEWQLTDVIDGQRFVITGLTPDGQGALSFDWRFDDVDGGTRMTQRIKATGPEVPNHMGVLRQMESDAPQGMAQLCATLDELASQ